MQHYVIKFVSDLRQLRTNQTQEKKSTSGSHNVMLFMLKSKEGQDFTFTNGTFPWSS